MAFESKEFDECISRQKLIEVLPVLSLVNRAIEKRFVTLNASKFIHNHYYQ